jgi:hypothetical protein
VAEPDIPEDPFQEHGRRAWRRSFGILGSRFDFESTSAELLEVVEGAYAGLPTHQWGRKRTRCCLTLALTPGRSTSSLRVRRPSRDPLPPRLFSAGRDLCAVGEESSFVTVSPGRRSATVAVSPRLLKSPYHLRYEIIDLAVYLLAARCRDLIPLHSACISCDDRAILLTGPSGSGKSTIALHWLAQGLDFVAEDSVLVDPVSAHATGLANFIHLRGDALRFLESERLREAVRGSPVIRRRSGVRKFEVDLRSFGCHLAPRAPRVRAIVFASAKQAPPGGLLTPMHRSEAIARLCESQPYAARQRGWSAFTKRLMRIEAYELHRGRHPSEATCVLRELVRKP